MKQLLNLFEKLTSFQKSILDEQEQFVTQSNDFLDQQIWEVPTQFESGIKVDQLEIDGSLLIQSSLDEDISLILKSSLLSKPFNLFDKFLPGEKISVEFNGSMKEGNDEVRLFLKQLNNLNIIQKDVFHLNENQIVEINPSCEKLSLELNICGNTSVSIHHLKVDRVPKIVSKDFIQASENQFIYKPTPKKIKDLKVACIFDVFTISCYEKEVDLIPITPENCLYVLEQNKPDIFIVESAWKGNYGTWEFKIAEYNNQSNDALKSAIKWCNSKGIPTVFWNKEDPVHFQRFIKSASLFDVIFTTDANMIPEYTKVVNHDRVYALPFAAQPLLHNPIKIVDERIEKICFAGSYYDNRHPERRQDMEEILDLCAEFGLDIYDRNYNPSNQDKSDLSFPERFHSNVIGSLPYSQIATAYKGYKVMLNVNSVKYSPTMFSRRVFEGLACGTPVVSTYSEGIRRMFKNLVIISKDKDMFREEVKKLFANKVYYRTKSLEGIREVYLNHTYRDRIQMICEKSNVPIINKRNTINMVSIVESSEQFYKVLKY
ncbi:glycosyltransferase, partial [Gottfriedia acidiceleris]|uniref:CgeB family protein n=1 Tax=Gottfriedia acidiceleris TaxID=371036 RepID=UPI0033991B8B